MNKEIMKRFAIPLILCVFAGAACWPFDGEQALAAMTLRREGDGRVQILRPAEDAIDVGDEDVAVLPGDIIRTYDGGLAQVALEGERIAWVGGRKQPVKNVAEAQMQILTPTAVEADTGTVMAEATDAMKVRFGDATASGSDGVFRVDRRAGAARAASYQGTLRVSAPGEANVEVDRLFEVPATASDLRPARPYRLDPADPFDSRQLDGVIELENTLGLISQGLISQLGRQKPRLGYFRAFAGRKNINPMKPYLRRPAIDLLLGFTIALNSKAYRFGEALDEAFTNRDGGGSWGVVAAIVRADPKLLVADLNNIIDASQIVAGGNSGPDFTAAAAQDASSGSVAAPSGGGGDGSQVLPPDGGGGGGGGGGGDDPDEPDEAEDCQGQAECALQDATEGLPQPDPSPSNILDGV